MSMGAEDRVHELQQEREGMQKRTFTRWMNSFLKETGLVVSDLFLDLSDGTLLMLLLEILSGTELPSATRGRLRVHKLENCNKALGFLKASKVKLEAIGPENIVDGDPTRILGLIWTIILRFQIQEIKLEGDAKSAKDALLYWCKKVTQGHAEVDIKNFTTSWKNGLGFAAIIHHFRPDLIDYDSLSPSKPLTNMELAFNVAETHLGISSLLEAEDVVRCSDEKSVITYLVAYYHYFSKLKTEEVDLKRLAKLMAFLLEMDEIQNEYEIMAQRLLEWVFATTERLRTRDLANDLAGLKAQLGEFKQYRTVDKPPKFVDRGNVEAHLFGIQTRLFSQKHPMYHPPEGLLISDINEAWEALEHEEHEREMALRRAMIRQERLELLAAKFQRKADLRESWLEDNERIIRIDDFGSDLAAVQASVKRHEAIDADIVAHEERIRAVLTLAEELRAERYHSAETVAARADAIGVSWDRLRQLLLQRRQRLDEVLRLARTLREMDLLDQALEDLLLAVSSEDLGRHLQECEELLQRHALHEADIELYHERVLSANAQAQLFIDQGHPRAADAKQRQQQLSELHEQVTTLAEDRKAQLEAAVALQLYLRDADELMAWIAGKEPSAASTDCGRDLVTVTNLQRRHNALVAEIKEFEKSDVAPALAAGLRLASAGHYAADTIDQQNRAINAAFAELKARASVRRRLLQHAAKAASLRAEVDDADSYLRERAPTVHSDDFGRDQLTTASLLKKHEILETELRTFADTVVGIERQSEALTSSSAEHDSGSSSAPLKHLRAMYSYAGKSKRELTFTKGDLLVLVDDSNKDWWNVRAADGRSGFVPATYVRVSRSSVSATPPAATPSSTTSGGSGESAVNTQLRSDVTALRTAYAALLEGAAARRQRLENAQALHALSRQADELETWMEGRLALAAADDLGSSLEQTTALRTKFADFDKELQANQRRLEQVRELAAQLAASGDVTEAERIRQRQAELEAQWEALQRQAERRRHELEVAAKAKALGRDLAEAQAWVREKTAVAEREDTGKDLRSAEALLRQHAQFESDLDAVDRQNTTLQDEATRFAQTHPDAAASVTEPAGRLQAARDALRSAASRRGLQLEQAHRLQQYMSDHRDLCSWLRDATVRVQTEDLPSTAAAAHDLLLEHDALRAELDARLDTVEQLQSEAAALVTAAPETVSPLAAQLDAALLTIEEGWAARDSTLRQQKRALEYISEAHRLENVFAAQLHALASDDVGQSLGGVEQLLRDHTLQEQSVGSHTEQADALLQQGATLAADGVRAAEIEAGMVALDSARGEVLSALESRTAQLASSRRLHLWLRDADELATWVKEAARSASDPSYENDANLRGKLQAHEALEGGLAAHEPALAECLAQAPALQDELAPVPLQRRAVEEREVRLGEDWEALCAAAAEKGHRLREALQQQEFNLFVADYEAWCTSMEKALAETDVGRDRAGVALLLKRQEVLEADFAAQRQRLSEVTARSTALLDAGHFRAAAIRAKADEAALRYAEMEPRLAVRREELEAAQAVHAFSHEADFQLSLLSEKQQQASSSDVGRDLANVQTLAKMHDVLASQVVQLSGALDNLNRRGDTLLADAAGPWHSEVRAKAAELTAAQATLTEALAARSERLEQALEAERFLADAAAAYSLALDRQALASRTELGQNAVATQRLLSQNTALLSDLAVQAEYVAKLGATGRALAAASHPDVTRILASLGDLDELMAELQEQGALRRARLEDQLALHRFEQDAEEARATLEALLAEARATEVGEDEERCLELQERFDSFLTRLEPLQTDVVGPVATQARAMAAAGHPAVTAIEARATDIAALWDALQTSAAERADGLAQAATVHHFTREAGELLTRMQDKRTLVDLADYGRDLATVQALQRRHDGYENDMAALEAQLDVLRTAATRAAAVGGDAGDKVPLRLAEVETAWADLLETTERVHGALAAAQDLQLFYRDARHYTTWASGVLKATEAEAPARNLDEATQQADAQRERKADADAHDSEYHALAETATALSQRDTLAGPVATRLGEVDEAYRALHEGLTTKAEAQAQQLAFLAAARDCRSAHLLLSEQETFVAAIAGGVADSLGTVSALQEKLVELQTLRAAQAEKVANAAETMQALVSSAHPRSTEAEELAQQLATRADAVTAACEAQTARLAAASALQLLLRDADELLQWMSLNLKVASDGAYREPANLLPKQQKHAALAAEVTARQAVVDALQARAMEVTAAAAEATAAATAAASAATAASSASAVVSASAKSLPGSGTGSSHSLLSRRTSNGSLTAATTTPGATATPVTAADVARAPTAADGAVRNVQRQWAALQAAVQEKTEGLRQAVAVAEYSRQVDELCADLDKRQAEVAALQPDTDLEGTERAEKRLSDLETELKGEEARAETLAAHADSLAEQAQLHRVVLREHQRALRTRWAGLQTAAATARRSLAAALEVQTYLRDAAEAGAWIAEKRAAVDSDDYGRDVAGVEALQRQHETLVRDFGAVDERLAVLGKEARRLQRVHRTSAEAVRQAQQDLEQRWVDVHATAQRRKAKLADARDLQQLLNRAQDLASWVRDSRSVMEADELAKDVHGADVLLKRHRDARAEIDAREAGFAAVMQTGRRLVARKHYAAAEVEGQLAQLTNDKEALLALWKERARLYEQSHELQLFLRDAEQLVAWVDAHLPGLREGALGDSLDGVDALLKQQAEFNKALAAQEEKVRSLRAFAQRLEAEQHYEQAAIAVQLAEVEDSQRDLTTEALAYGERLAASRRLQQFLRDAREVEDWMDTRRAVAEETSYLDTASLARKLQRHDAFEAELAANEGRVQALLQSGESLAAAADGAAATASEVTARVAEAWNTLRLLSEDKGRKLRQAQQERDFDMRAAQVLEWCAGADEALATADAGSDLASVRKLLKRHAALEAELASHGDRAAELAEEAQQLAGDGHFHGAALEQKAAEVVAAHAALLPLAEARELRLKASRQLHQFMRDAETELAWVAERLPQASLADFGSDLTSTQSLHKRFQALALEVLNHTEPHSALVLRGESHVAEGHYAASELQAMVHRLGDDWAALQAAVQHRQAGLEDALRAQDYFSQASEAEAWLREKAPLAESRSVGDSEDATGALLQQHQAMSRELDAFGDVIEHLRQEQAALESARNRMADRVAARQTEVEALYASLSAQATEREVLLQATEELHQFERQRADLAALLERRGTLAQRPDLGADKDEGEAMVKVHETLLGELRKDEERLEALEAWVAARLQGKAGAAAGAGSESQSQQAHPQSEAMESGLKALRTLSSTVQEDAQVRRQRLADALVVHTFRREAENTLMWVDEKTAALAEVPMDDLATVERLQRQHAILEGDLAALGARVASLESQTSSLAVVQPERADDVQKTMLQVRTGWETLQALVAGRAKALEDAHALHGWLATYRDLTVWCQHLHDEILAEDPAGELAGVEAQRAQHAERKAALEARRPDVAQFEARGEALEQAGHPDTMKIQDTSFALQKQVSALQTLWAAHEDKLRKAEDLCGFLRDAESAQSWMALRGSFLENDKVPETMDEVEAVLKQYEDFERSLAAQEERFNRLQELTEAEREAENEEKEAKEKAQRQAEAAKRKEEEAERKKALQAAAAAREAERKEQAAAQEQARQEAEAAKRQQDEAAAQKKALEAQAAATQLEANEQARQRAEAVQREEQEKADEERKRAREAERKEAEARETAARQAAAAAQAEADTAAAQRKKEEEAQRAQALAESARSATVDIMAPPHAADAASEPDTALSEEAPEAFTPPEGPPSPPPEEDEGDDDDDDKEYLAIGFPPASRSDSPTALAEPHATPPVADDNHAPETQARLDEEQRQREAVIERLQEQEKEHEQRRREMLAHEQQQEHEKQQQQQQQSAETEQQRRRSSTEEAEQGRRLSAASASPPASPDGDGAVPVAATTNGHRRPSSAPTAPSHIEGELQRKPELEAGGKRALIRSWKSVHVVATDGQIRMSHSRSMPPFLESPLLGAKCEVATGYSKRNFVLELTLSDGSQCLMQTANENDLARWVGSLQAMALDASAAAPHAAALGQPDSGGKRKGSRFGFSLGKK